MPLDKNTLFVLGAGASAPYGFPVGRAFALEIAAKARDGSLAQMLKGTRFHNPQQIIDFGFELQNSNQPSIDTFLESRADEYMELGKLAIAATLVPYEIYNNLRRNEKDAIKWYEYFFNKLGTEYNDFLTNKLKIVTFNYDRSLEFSLFSTIKNAFNADEEKIKKVFEAIEIVHVYGQLGEPVFLNLEGRDYEVDRHIDKIRKARDGIKIISEEGEELSEELKTAREYIKWAEQIVILGFGYHTENVNRLFPPEDKPNVSILGSAYGFTQTEQIEIREFLRNKLDAKDGHVSIGLNEQDNLDFLRAHTIFTR